MEPPPLFGCRWDPDILVALSQLASESELERVAVAKSGEAGGSEAFVE